MSARVLIADASKPSLVMTSEIFKDKMPGTSVIIAGTAAECLEKVKEEKPDLVLVDFDLPDADGPSLVMALRKVYKGPILMSAFPDPTVRKLAEEALFTSNDAGAWLKKPIKFDELGVLIEKFLVEGQRLGRRFDTELESKLIAKAAGRGKRAPKVNGIVTNISLGGAKLLIESPTEFEAQQEVTLSVQIPKNVELKIEASSKTKKKTTKKTTTKSRTTPTSETKFKAEIAWYTKRAVGVRFTKLSDIQKKGLESYLRGSLVVEEK